ncbi:hypothetical protein BX600DRAFT_505947 [Xylariales sp. PMI_506]|nr:hypothetical protein BX600DRAFT_505947 [Xylariales sp. PMI_506]
MHPAPTLADLLKSDDAQQQHEKQSQQHPVQLQQEQPGRVHQPEFLAGVSPRHSPQPVRKDTGSSISTAETDVTVTTNTTNDTNSTVYSVESSQSIFSVKDGAEIAGNRRASRRRTGPLSAAQREKAALIRKLGACSDCRRRRVACHPNHHNMTWEDAIRKYQRAHSPLQDLIPLAGRPLSAASNKHRLGFTQDSQEMEIDSATHSLSQMTPGRAQLSDSRIRTPLPSGPRLDKPMTMPPLAAAPPPLTPLPNIDFIKLELETAASRILSGPHSGRYSSVLALLLCWQDDGDPGVSAAMDDLAEVFERHYHFAAKTIKIPPSSSDGCKNSARWLSRTINDFTDNNDTRDVLKIVYYNGSTFLDDNDELVLASPSDQDRVSSIRWSGVQHFLEEACSDTLVIMDAAYYPSSKMVRQKGVLELLAASASEDHYKLLGRNTLTRAFAEHLRTRTMQRPPNSLSVAELHSKLICGYPSIVKDRHPDSYSAIGFPMPLHWQMSGNSRLASITLSPLPSAPPRSSMYSSDNPGGSHLTLSIRLIDETISIDSWTEWLRMMPEGIRDVQVDGPYRTFR